MDFKEFRMAIVDVPVEYEGATFTVGYRPRAMSADDLDFLAGLARIGAPAEESAPNRAAKRAAKKAPAPAAPERTLPDYLERLVVAWDLTWGGEPFPVCRESFEQMEPLMQAAVLGAVVRHYLERPNRLASSAISSAGEANGPTGETSATPPSTGDLVSFPGTTPDSPTPERRRSGASG